MVTDERKIPDVYAWFRDKGIVFEAQVSNESYHKVFGRVIFYRDLKNDGREWLTCWIFDEDVLSEKNFIVFEDIYHLNNRNVFMVNHQTEKCSVKEKRFYLKCRWEEPMIDSDTLQIIIIKKEEMVAFDELTLDFDKQRLFFFDFEGAKKRLEQELQERLERERLEKKRLEQLERERQEKERKRLEKELQERLERERLEKKRLEHLERERLKREEKERLMNNIVSLLNERLQWLEKQKSQLTQQVLLVRRLQQQLDDAPGIIEVQLVQLVMEPQLRKLLEKNQLEKKRLQEEMQLLKKREQERIQQLNNEWIKIEREMERWETSMIIEDLKKQRIDREQLEKEREMERLLEIERLEMECQNRLEMEWNREEERLNGAHEVTSEETPLDKSVSKDIYRRLPLAHRGIVCLFHKPALSSIFLSKKYLFHKLISLEQTDILLLAKVIFALSKLHKTVDAFCRHYDGTEYGKTLNGLKIINLRKVYSIDVDREFRGILEHFFKKTTVW